MTSLSWNENIFRKNDIRGIYNKDFDCRFVKLLGLHFPSFITSTLKQNPSSSIVIALGYDARISSPEIVSTLKEALLSIPKVKIKFLGLIPTPLCMFASYHCKDVLSSIMVTASHNAPHYNGFKICINKTMLFGPQLKTLNTYLANRIKSFHKKSSSNKNNMTFYNIKTPYIELLKKEFSSLRLFKEKILVDIGNGASGETAEFLFSSLKIKHSLLHKVPDGNFPHRGPDPVEEENLNILKTSMKQQNIPLGFALDGDGDRVVCVHKGVILKGDELIALFTMDILNSLNFAGKKSVVVADVKCADWFFQYVRTLPVHIHISPSGRNEIRQATINHNAIFGGEFCAHFFFNDTQFPLIDDGLYTILRFLKIYTLYKDHPFISGTPSFNTPEIRIPIDIPMSQLEKNLKKLRNHFAKCPALLESLVVDGVRISLKNAWGVARASHTTEEWTLRFGGKTKNELISIQSTFFRILELNTDYQWSP